MSMAILPARISGGTFRTVPGFAAPDHEAELRSQCYVAILDGIKLKSFRAIKWRDALSPPFAKFPSRNLL
jgi:hypothetical protein